jgi:glyoxylase-like metal-dependent hydrolase (beta-lactamase superfamily II)
VSLTAPAPGTMIPAAPGVHWIRMPLPYSLDHVNLWLLEDGDGWTMVDAGLGNDETLENWRRILSGPAGGRPVRRIVGTHFHPDHLGLAGRLAQETGAELWMTRNEWLTGRMLFLAGDEVGALQAAFLRSHGLPEAGAEIQAARGNTYRRRSSGIPPTYRRLQGGDVLEIGGRHWQVIIGEGHSPEHACLYCQETRILISGDQVLPTISPNVAVQWFEPEADPLSAFLSSNRRLAQLPEGTLVLPSHGRIFTELHRRLSSLERHHARRIAALAEACAQEPRSAYDLLDKLLLRMLDDRQIGFVLGETIAHLVHLERDGRLRRVLEEDGVWRWLAAPAGQR